DKILSAPAATFTVYGSAKTINISFSKVTYEATFTETGLPSGITWYVNLSNGDNSGAITGPSYSLMLINGTYSYTVATSNNTYKPSIPYASFAINGGAVNEPLNFIPVKYSITITETGIPSGTTWYLNLSNGESFKSTTSKLTVSITNGTYTYTVAGTSGYKPSTPSGSLSVTGSNTSKTVKFTAPPPSKTSTSYFGLSPLELYAIIGAVIAAIAIGLAAIVIKRRR
ncbi:MAG: hypothetical protein QXZ44_05985, partial [Ferroplasma sp.]